MPTSNTEAHNALSTDLDILPPVDVLARLHRQQIAAAQAVESAYPAIALAANAMAGSVRDGGRLVYAAAGSSALMGIADGLELPGTFSIPQSQVVILMAGGLEALTDMVGGPEDNADEARNSIRALKLNQHDCVICLSASGTTPYALAAIEESRAVGAGSIIGIACNDKTPVLLNADIAIHLPTPAEIVSGSTRMGAGTAQKIALNMLSTLMATHLGHIHDGYMVNVRADNEKLRERAKSIVISVTDCDDATAETALAQADNAVKVAVLLAAGAHDVDTAKELLAGNGQKLRPALACINPGASPQSRP